MDPSDSENAELDRETSYRAHRWLHFFQHARIFVSVLLVILVIDIIGGTNDFFVQWVAAIWGTILALHFLDTLLVGRLLGFRRGHCGWEARGLERTGRRSE